jgi:hypothetical protein
MSFLGFFKFLTQEIAIDLEDPFEHGTEPEFEIHVEKNPKDTNVTHEDKSDTVTLEVPLSVVNEIEKAIDISHGEDPELEAHHHLTPEDADKTVDVEIPATDAKDLEESFENKLDEEVVKEDNSDVKEIKNVEDFYEAIKKSNGSVKLSGFYPGYYGTYAFIINLND